MCESKKTCQKPEECSGRKPEQCSPEQIKICHGDEKGHPCVDETKADQ